MQVYKSLAFIGQAFPTRLCLRSMALCVGLLMSFGSRPIEAVLFVSSDVGCRPAAACSEGNTSGGGRSIT